jgi:hypothetical protein
MNQQQALDFLKALGVSHAQYKPGWVTAACPFAPFRHKGGKDSNPSFGLKYEVGVRSYFNCFACGSGPAEELLQALEMYTMDRPHLRSHYDFKHARAILTAEDDELSVLPNYKEFGQETTKQFEEWPWHFINSFLPLNEEAIGYLTMRDVTFKQMVDHSMRWDPKKRMVVMPYLNAYDKLAGARGRSIDSNVQGWKKHWDYTWNGVNNTALCWYNEQALQLTGPVVVVEGQFDVLRVAQVYPKVVGNMMAHPTRAKLLKLLHSPRVVLIPDNDGPGGAGEKSVKHYREFMFAQGHGQRFTHLQLPLPEGQLKIDPAECHPQFLKDLLVPVIN